ncbi:MAG: phosphotransferase, partial [Pseudomonadota bacterium]
SPAKPDGPPVRGGKSYSSIAKLAEDVCPFVAIARHLRGAGFSAPEIVSADLDRGVLLIEDFGSDGFWTAVPDTAQQACDLANAIDTLAALRCANLSTRMAAAGETGTYELPAFDETARHIEAELLLDWAWPSLTQSPLASATRENYVAAWMAAFANIDTAADEPGWVLRDVHSPNLIRLPDRVSPANVGLLDFQDALAGAWAYDVASLLQDARKDVPPDLEIEMKERYIARLSEQTAVPFDRKQFEAAYAFWGAQRAAKIIGIFHRLDARDGKPAYLAHLPRLTHALSRNLDHPALAPVAAWFARHLPEIHRNDRS